MNQITKTIIDFFVVLLTTLCVLGFFLSDIFLFRAKAPSYTDNEQIIKLTTEDGTRLSAMYFPLKDAKYTILVSHGNGEDIGRTQKFAQQLNREGYSAMVYDYYGYGTSEGRPNEQNSYLAVEAAYQFLTEKQHIPPRQIIAYGHSLGSGVASYLANTQPVAALIIDGAFLSAFRVVTMVPLLPFDKFNTASRIQNIDIPKLFIHGTEDEVIPFWHGEALYEMANPPKSNLWVQQGKHNNVTIVSGETYWQKWRELVRDIETFQYPN